MVPILTATVSSSDCRVAYRVGDTVELCSEKAICSTHLRHWYPLHPLTHTRIHYNVNYARAEWFSYILCCTYIIS